MERFPAECDVLILGGGSAGCVLAARLSEDPRLSVVLVEAGKDLAVGAQISASGRSTVVRAGEIILSCGTIHSPAALMRSGIGPADHLRALGIPLVTASAGVGRNLIEHPVVSVSCYLTRPARLKIPSRHHTRAHLRFSSGLADCPSGDMSLAIIVRSGWHAMGRRVGSLYVWVNKSYSQGSVALRSNRVADPPDIDFRMLSDWRDLTRLRDAFRFVSDIAFDEELARLRTHASRGVAGLRVCDASLMPAIPCANTNIPTIMVAERIADLISAERAGSAASLAKPMISAETGDADG